MVSGQLRKSCQDKLISTPTNAQPTGTCRVLSARQPENAALGLRLQDVELEEGNLLLISRVEQTIGADVSGLLPGDGVVVELVAVVIPLIVSPVFVIISIQICNI